MMSRADRDSKTVIPLLCEDNNEKCMTRRRRGIHVETGKTLFGVSQGLLLP